MNRRGQVVLLGAVMIAIAFVPLVLASLQLGYHEDVRASAPDGNPTGDARMALHKAVHFASLDVAGEYTWSRRAAAARTVRSRLAPPIERIETSRIQDGIYRTVAYNASRAREWIRGVCPHGPNRQFGDCEVVDGVVVQDRAGWTHVLAIAFDLATTTERGHTALTTVIRPIEVPGRR